MARIYDPVQLEHPKLRSFALRAAWIAAAAEAANDLEDLLVDVPPEERHVPDFSTPWPWEFDSLVFGLAIIRRNREAAEVNLEELLAHWLEAHPISWPRLRAVIDPWQERPGIWSAGTPEWLRTLGTIGETAHARNERYGHLPNGAGESS